MSIVYLFSKKLGQLARETMLVHKNVIRVGKLTCWVFNDYANVANVNLL